MRIVAVIVGVAVVAAAALLISGRDNNAGVPVTRDGLDPDRGAAHSGPAPADGIPTSGAHRPDLVTRDGGELTNDQLLHAIELGNVVILADRVTPALRRLQREVSGRFDAEIAAAGQAVILGRRAGAGPATAVAWRASLPARSATDPELRGFVEDRLGTGMGQ